MSAAGGIIPNHRQLDLNDGCRFGFDSDLLAAQYRRRLHHRVNDGRVGRASANVPSESCFYIVSGGPRILVEKSFGCDNPTSGTEAAIRGNVRVADPLQWM